MGRTYDAIDDRLAEFLRAQHVFFVGTAPAEGGHVNVSPKGLDTFAVLGPRTVAYLDLTGSGIETIAHVRENERITLLYGSMNLERTIHRYDGLSDLQPETLELIAHWSNPTTEEIEAASARGVA